MSNFHHHASWAHSFRQLVEATNNPPALVIAGFAPNLVNHVFTLSVLQIVYFALLIPPAGFHCWNWFRKAVLPGIRRLRVSYLIWKGINKLISPIMKRIVK